MQPIIRLDEDAVTDKTSAYSSVSDKQDGRYWLVSQIARIGWIAYMIWLAMIVLVPDGPLYAFVHQPISWMILAVVMIILPLALVASFAASLSSSRALLGIAIGGFVALIGSIASGIFGYDSLKLFCFGVMIAGFTVIWRPLFASVKRLFLHDIVRMIAEGFVFVLMATIVGMLDVMSVLYYVLPGVSLVCFFVFYRHYGSDWRFVEKEDSKKLDQIMMAEPRRWLFVEHYIAGTTIGCFIVCDMASDNVLMAIGIALFAAALVIACTREVIFKSLQETWIVWYTLLVGIPLLMCIPFVDGLGLMLIGALGLFAARTREAINPTLSVEQSYLDGRIDLFRSSKKAFSRTTGIVLGAFASSVVLFLPGQAGSFLYFGALVYVLAVTALVALQYLWKQQNNNAPEDDESIDASAVRTSAKESDTTIDQDTWEHKVGLVASEYGLTSRQENILQYLSRGRSANYIANECGISLATVKSHIYTIYKKTNMHNKQEIINLIERANSVK